MLARRHGARTFGRGLRLGVAFQSAHMRGRAERRVGKAWHPRRIGCDQRGFTLVPGRQQFRIRQTTDQAGMNEARKIHARNVPGRGVHALEIPDRLLRQREMVGQKAAAILLGEEAVEAPEAFLHRADVEQIDHQQVAGLGALDADRAGQEVHDRQVDVAHVVGGIVVLDEAAGPVIGLDDEVVARAYPGNHRNVGMPPIVDLVVIVGRLGQIDLDQCIRHQQLPWFYKLSYTDKNFEICAASTLSRGSSRTISPFSMTSTRSAMSSAKLSTCSDTTMERPRSSRIRFKVRAMSLMIDGWMPSVGSSSSSTFGLVASARAIASCCCCPPERLPPRRPFISKSTGNNS